MSVTKKKIDESAFIIAKDNITNNVQTVVVPSNFQVGLKTSPSDLTLTGKFSTSEKDYVANSSNNWTLSLEDHVTVSSISTTYSSSSRPSAAYVVINLPKNPRVGQLVIIKEFSGTASVIPLRIYDASSKTIDGANYKTISSDYGALQFFWQGNNWISISNATVASGAAPDSASYVVIGSNAILTNERTLAAGSGISIVDGGAGAAVTISATGGGSGDVVGPSSSTDNAVVRFDLTTGKLIQNSVVTIADTTGNITTPGDIAINGGDLTTTAATMNLVNGATTINLGSTAITRAINIGTNATNVQTINIGTGAAANIISVGSATGAASLTLQSGTGGINVGTSNVARTINIGSDPAGTATTQQTINIGAKNTSGFNMLHLIDEDSSNGHEIYILSDNGTQASGTSVVEIGTVAAATTIDIGKSTVGVKNVTIGGTGGASSLTLDSGTGNIDIGTSTASGRTINVGTGTAYQDINIGNNSTANQVVIYGGAPLFGVGGIYLTGSAGTTYTIGGETGTGTISLGRSTASNTINIGNGTTATGNTQTVNIAASASGTGLAAITIGNTNGASSLTLNAGTGLTTIDSHAAIARTALISYPSDTVTDYPMQLKVVTGGDTIRWAIGADTGSDLNFSYSLNSTTVASKGYLANTVDVAAIDFTGQHRNYPVGGNVLDFSDKIGLIVASVGRYKSLTSSSAEISINEALPMVELSTKRNQKSVFGVISDHEDPNETSREYVIGNWGSVYEKMQNDDRLIINSLGEGAIWICNVNGNLQNGDYITSCEVPGYGMKQDDDVLHNYTVAKITCDCDFSLDSTVYQCEEFRHEGKTYRRAFVGCTYHCG